ncbi:MAG: protein kinase domain-containing protein [Gammaproteobacteria bacterium]|jgi:serine/threonine protein kinase
MDQHRNALPNGHQVHWYVIQKVLGQGGLGITYLAEDANLGRQVAIKEYLPTDMAYREKNSSIHPVSGETGELFNWGLDRFISEAQTLARFKHPNIVQVFSVFKENNTAYMAMEFEQGSGLDQNLKQKNTLPEQTLMNILLPLLDGLEQVHEIEFIHRDIKPANIYLREDGTPVLLDFGSARQSLSAQTSTLTAMVSPGFAPFEQYTSKGERQGPWTDIYGLGATLYRSIIGRAPANAMDRSDAILHTSKDIFVAATEINPGGYSLSLLNAVDYALAFRPEDRPQSISIWRDILLQDHSITAATVAAIDMKNPVSIPTITIGNTRITNTIASTEKQTDNNPNESMYMWRWLGVTGIVVLFIVIMGIWANGSRQSLDVSGQSQLPSASSVEDKNSIDIASTDQQYDETISSNIVSTPEPSIAEIDTATTQNSTPEQTTNLDDIPTSQISTLEPVAITDKPEAITDSTSTSTDRRPLRATDTDVAPLEQLRRRLQQNPQDTDARQKLRSIYTQYERRVREAVRDKKFDQAESTLKEMLTIAPENEKLQESLKRVQEMSRRQ